MSGRVYLDWNATAPLLPEAAAAIARALALTGNPSSVHAEGRRARAMVEAAREDVARLGSWRAHEIVFTAGGTEANHLALRGTAAALAEPTLLVSAIEHPSLVAAAHATGRPLRTLPVTGEGVLDLDALEQALRLAPGPAIVSVMAANNETGIVQPLREIAARVRAAGGVLHTDAVQCPGRLPPEAWAEADLLSLSAHKCGGPQGVGALVVRDGTPFAASRLGGGQEAGRRAGTENVAGIAGFGAAVAALARDVQAPERMAALRDALEAAVLACVPGVRILGREVARLPNTSCLALPGLAAATQVIVLDLAGVAVSAGSACASGKVQQSHVLAAMSLADDISASAIRVSLGPATTDGDIARFIEAWAAQAGRRRQPAEFAAA